MLEISKFTANTWSVRHIDLSWEIKPTEEDIYRYSFLIYRAGSPEGPYNLLTPEGLQDTYFFRDGNVFLSSKFKKYYYKLVVADTASDARKEYGPITLLMKPDIVALEIARKNMLLFERFSGIKVWLFKVRKFGSYCSCYDKRLGQKTKSNCLTCFNTGWAKGYHRPIICHVQLLTPAENLIQSNVGDIERIAAFGHMGAYPLVDPRDVIVCPDNTRWRVASPIENSYKLGYIVRQKFGLSKISPTEIEFKIPILQKDYEEYQAFTGNFEKIYDYYSEGEEGSLGEIINDNSLYVDENEGLDSYREKVKDIDNKNKIKDHAVKEDHFSQEEMQSLEQRFGKV